MRKRAKKDDIPSLEQLERIRSLYIYRHRYRTTFISTVMVLITAAAVSVLVTMLYMPVYRIYGSSMSPALENGQVVVAVRSHSYKQGDMVAFYYGNKLLIKRVIACPGDVVNVCENGDVYINGNYLDEPYVSEKTFNDSDMEYPVTVADEHWFLMGDNRTVSVDSRDKQIGCVSQEQIAGKIVLRVWPLDKIKKLTIG